MEIGVYGLGRFGSFWAQLLAKRFEVKGYNRSNERPAPEGVERVSLDRLVECPVIFLCVSISAMEPVVSQLRSLLREDVLLIDTCSVKVHPVSVMERSAPSGAQIIGTHPMFGPDSAKNGTEGLPLIFTPVRVDSSTAEFWREHFAGLGLNVMEMSADQHDHEAAYTQGITHFVGRLLKELNVQPSPMSTLGYRKILEVVDQTCNDPYQLFVDLQRYNPYSANMRDNLRGAFDTLISRLSSELDSPQGRE